MPTSNEQFQPSIRFKDAAASTFERELKAVASRMNREIQKYVGLYSTIDGKFVGDTASLGRLVNSRNEIDRIMVAARFPQTVQAFSDQYPGLAKRVAKDWKSAGIDASFTRTNARALQAVAGSDLTQLADVGRAGVDAMHQGLVRAVTGGGGATDFSNELAQQLVGRKDRRGVPMFVHAATIAQTSIDTLNRTMTAQLADSAGIQWFLYDGPLNETTRTFCIARVRRIFHRSEIDAMNNGQIDNVFVTMGGFNCQHDWIPVLDDEVPEGVKSRIGATTQEPTVKGAAKLRAQLRKDIVFPAPIIGSGGLKQVVKTPAVKLALSSTTSASSLKKQLPLMSIAELKGLEIHLRKVVASFKSAKADPSVKKLLKLNNSKIDVLTKALKAVPAAQGEGTLGGVEVAIENEPAVATIKKMVRQLSLKDVQKLARKFSDVYDAYAEQTFQMEEAGAPEKQIKFIRDKHKKMAKKMDAIYDVLQEATSKKIVLPKKSILGPKAGPVTLSGTNKASTAKPLPAGTKKWTDTQGAFNAIQGMSEAKQDAALRLLTKPEITRITALAVKTKGAKADDVYAAIGKLKWEIKQKFHTPPTASVIGKSPATATLTLGGKKLGTKKLTLDQVDRLASDIIGDDLSDAKWKATLNKTSEASLLQLQEQVDSLGEGTTSARERKLAKQASKQIDKRLAAVPAEVPKATYVLKTQSFGTKKATDQQIRVVATGISGGVVKTTGANSAEWKEAMDTYSIAALGKLKKALTLLTKPHLANPKEMANAKKGIAAINARIEKPPTVSSAPTSATLAPLVVNPKGTPFGRLKAEPTNIGTVAREATGKLNVKSPIWVDAMATFDAKSLRAIQKKLEDNLRINKKYPGSWKSQEVSYMNKGLKALKKRLATGVTTKTASKRKFGKHGVTVTQARTGADNVAGGVSISPKLLDGQSEAGLLKFRDAVIKKLSEYKTTASQARNLTIALKQITGKLGLVSKATAPPAGIPGQGAPASAAEKREAKKLGIVVPINSDSAANLGKLKILQRELGKLLAEQALLDARTNAIESMSDQIETMLQLSTKLPVGALSTKLANEQEVIVNKTDKIFTKADRVLQKMRKLGVTADEVVLAGPAMQKSLKFNQQAEVKKQINKIKSDLRKADAGTMKDVEAGVDIDEILDIFGADAEDTGRAFTAPDKVRKLKPVPSAAKKRMKKAISDMRTFLRAESADSDAGRQIREDYTKGYQQGRGIVDTKMKPLLAARPNQTRRQSDAAEVYKSDEGYQAVNAFLRGRSLGNRGSQSMKNLCANIDDCIANTTVAKDTVVYRGVGNRDPKRYNHWKVGTTFTDTAYGSWSGSYHTATNFASETGTKGVVIRTVLPAGSHAQIYAFEAELLLPRGQTYRVVSVEKFKTDKEYKAGGRTHTEATHHTVVTVELVNLR